ncbi:hypothetical protein B0I35DRAFT_483390 [Stachybotrys elegans]|uniref:NADH dehydrogenase [ubiquinone] 1 alpha subcomplex assembly factor 3 n=1 Tax=Stachybotrys elegans TaxID=80388 RepID=A0A8K0SKJ6_9HYPO|nr:hypothetical protein B0I35DRAFT_483390 [Stachybotrys elegans]
MSLPAQAPCRQWRPSLSISSSRCFSSNASRLAANRSNEKSATDIAELDILAGVPIPSTSVDVCMYDGFGLNSGKTITGGDGALLVHGEAFSWRPWVAKGSMELVNKKGQFEIPAEAFGLMDLLWPRPDLLVLGVGKSIMPLSPKTRQALSELGIRVEVLDTRNAAAQFNLLATERGVNDVAAALIPMGWQEGIGAKA